MKIKIVLALVVVLVNLNCSFAKNNIPGCTGNKQDVCNVLKERNGELEACEEEKSNLQDQFDVLQKRVDALEKEKQNLESENQQLKTENQNLKEENKDLKEENQYLADQLAALKKVINQLKQEITGLEQELANLRPKPTASLAPPAPKSCIELLKSGKTTSGIYTIDPDGQGAFEVYCDQKSRGGGWVIIQRRNGGTVDFSRGWSDYKVGFGIFGKEWWLGLDKIHRITSQTSDLRIGLIDQQDKSAQALYSGFSIGAESTQYQLSLGKFEEGTAGDSMSVHKGRKFSTKDRDNDLSAGSNCAVSLNGGWWYYGVAKCADANLNGQYGKNVFYRSWKGGNYSLKKTAMRVRPAI